ncbi:FAD-binding oxidoreductase [Terrarubrum flagellatum]|uniref:FAD-binding oxidoreductase n=1 Tax=Terrirubrum flagellatum TaxID=2895980 RepID=UPI003145090F
MSVAVEKLLATLGPDIVKVGAEVPDRNTHDEAGLPPARPLALVLPRNVEQVSAALSICHAERQPVVTQGGLTGLAGGAHPGASEIALSLERMTGVEEVDPSSGTLTALAGTPLQIVQQAADDAGFMCGIDLGARGSCTIGGNIATNAGGNQVLRYGMARKNVLGLEVVQADGAIVRSLNKMMKNNAGYDWTQLFIGSEGTLGVVTRVVLGLHPKPQGVKTALVAVSGHAAALKVLRFIQAKAAGGLLVFEGMWREMYEIATTIVGVAAPLERGHDLYLLIEIAGGADLADGSDVMESVLGELYEQNLIKDAVVAKSGSESDKLWALRESVYEYGRLLPKQIGFDVSIPLDRMAESVERFRKQILAAAPDCYFVVFGHIADSNLHLLVMPKEYSAEIEKSVNNVVYGVTADLGGSISAEHGIGRLKRPYLSRSRTEPELALMRTIKAALDPAGILNPGRVI